MKRGASKHKAASSPPTLGDIARLASVSLPTASLAMSNHPRVSERTRLRVMDVATRLGYVPNHVARDMVRSRLNRRGGTFDQVGFVCVSNNGPSALVDAPIIAVMYGAEQEASVQGATLVFLSLVDEDSRAKLEHVFKTAGMAGWLVIGSVDDSALQLIRAPYSPVVVVGRHTCKRPVHNVDLDYPLLGRMAAERFASQGHRSVVFMGGSMRHSYQWEVLEGFRKASHELGLEDNGSRLPPLGSIPGDPLRSRLKAVLALRPLPTALFMEEPGFAGMALDFMEELHDGLPEGMSMLGCELDGGAGAPETIDRFELPLAEVGRAGVSLLREMVGRGSLPPRQVLVAPRIVEGKPVKSSEKRRSFMSSRRLQGDPRNAGFTLIERVPSQGTRS
jgi:DNA-binding LacI/PurR family transcriptional regulator